MKGEITVDNTCQNRCKDSQQSSMNFEYIGISIAVKWVASYTLAPLSSVSCFLSNPPDKYVPLL